MRIWTIISLIVILRALIVLTFFLGQDVSLIKFKDSWVNLNLRYLVPARERRGTKNAILESIFAEFTKPENAARIKPVYPRSQIQQIDKSGMPKD